MEEEVKERYTVEPISEEVWYVRDNINSTVGFMCAHEGVVRKFAEIQNQLDSAERERDEIKQRTATALKFAAQVEKALSVIQTCISDASKMPAQGTYKQGFIDAAERIRDAIEAHAEAEVTPPMTEWEIVEIDGKRYRKEPKSRLPKKGDLFHYGGIICKASFDYVESTCHILHEITDEVPQVVSEQEVEREHIVEECQVDEDGDWLDEPFWLVKTKRDSHGRSIVKGEFYDNSDAESYAAYLNGTSLEHVRIRELEQENERLKADQVQMVADAFRREAETLRKCNPNPNLDGAIEQTLERIAENLANSLSAPAAASEESKAELYPKGHCHNCGRPSGQGALHCSVCNPPDTAPAPAAKFPGNPPDDSGNWVYSQTQGCWKRKSEGSKAEPKCPKCGSNRRIAMPATSTREGDMNLRCHCGHEYEWPAPAPAAESGKRAWNVVFATPDGNMAFHIVPDLTGGATMQEAKDAADWLNRRSEIEARLSALQQQEAADKDHRAMEAVRKYELSVHITADGFECTHNTGTGHQTEYDDDPADAILALAAQLEQTGREGA